MPTTADIRRQNLELLIAKAGTLEQCADIGDTNWVYLSQLRHQALDSKNGRPREMGTRLARKLEDKFGLPSGWMDQVHEAAPPHSEDTSGATIAPLDVSNSPQVCWGEKMLEKLPPVFAVEIPDDAMAPRVRAGDVVRFSTTIAPTPGDGVLVVDSARRWYFRIYKSVTEDEWAAHPLNEGYTTMNANQYQLSVVGVLIGIESQRWGSR